MRSPGFLGSIVTCPSCPQPPYSPQGVITQVKPFHLTINGLQPAYEGDIGTCDGPTVLLSSVPNFTVNGIPIHLVADPNTCGGVTLNNIPSNFYLEF